MQKIGQACLGPDSDQELARVIIAAQLLRSGAIKSHISKELAFDEMADAHQAMESGRTVGKIVINL